MRKAGKEKEGPKVGGRFDELTVSRDEDVSHLSMALDVALELWREVNQCLHMIVNEKSLVYFVWFSHEIVKKLL